MLMDGNRYLTLFSSVLHVKMLMRLWDVLFFDGSKVLFQVRGEKSPLRKTLEGNYVN